MKEIGPINIVVVITVIAYLLYFFLFKKRQTDTPVMRKVYGYNEGEKLEKMWLNGTLWLREVSNTEQAVKRVGNIAGVLLGFYIVSVYERYALSLTEEGWYILKDCKEENNIGIIRFKKADIKELIRLNQEESVSASGFMQFEKTYPVQLTLNNGNYFWIQIPKSAYKSMTT
jgi:hypothetical protein